MAEYTSNQTGNIALTSTDAEINVPSGTVVFSGVISGAFRLQKTGNGTAVFTGTNTFSEGITVDAGTFQYQAATNLGVAPTNDDDNYIILNGGVFELKSPNQTDVSIPATMGITVSDPSTISNTSVSTSSADAGSLDIESVITGSTHAITFAGLNTNNNGSTMNVINLGTRTHTGSGTATVGRGLTVGSNGTTSWNFAVNGDLKGRGTYNGNVDINSTGRLIPGASVGTDMIIGGNLTIDDGAEIWVSYNGNTQAHADDITVNGTGTCKVGDTANGVKLFGIPSGYTGTGNIGAATYSVINFAGTGVTVNSDAATNVEVQQYAATQSDASNKTPVNRLTTNGYSVTFTSNNLNLVRT